jgi:MFS family permease
MRDMFPLSASREGSEASQAFLWSYILNTPFWAIYNILPMILYKDLAAPLWLITLMITLKPVVSIFSVYWSDYVNKRADRLVPNVIVGNVIGHLPFLFFPWFDNLWWFIGSFAVYMLFYRGVIPAWMELLKLNTEHSLRQKIVAYSITVSYVGSAIFPVFFGWMMDDYFQAWRWIFVFTSLISLMAIFLQLRIPRVERPLDQPPKACMPLLRPWKNMATLLGKRPDYKSFQVGFMLGGFGIMILQPALPEFFVGTLNLNYKELGMAMTMCKGIGFALTSGLWANWMKRVDIFKFSALVVFLFSLFPLGLISAQYSLILLYVSYLGYGVMQAGSELAWKLSGPIFAMNEDSSLYSSVNVLTVGMRGCVASPLGGFLCALGGPALVMMIGSLFCLSAAMQLTLAGRSRLKLAVPEI